LLDRIPSIMETSMSRATFRNRSWWAAVGLALAVGLTAAGAARGSEVAPRMAVLPDGSIVELTCVAAGAWVDAHPDALPRTYADFSRFPLLYRKAIYADLPAAVQ